MSPHQFRTAAAYVQTLKHWLLVTRLPIQQLGSSMWMCQLYFCIILFLYKVWHIHISSSLTLYHSDLTSFGPWNSYPGLPLREHRCLASFLFICLSKLSDWLEADGTSSKCKEDSVQSPPSSASPREFGKHRGGVRVLMTEWSEVMKVQSLEKENVNVSNFIQK